MDKATDKQVGGNHYRNYAIQPFEFIQKNGLGYAEGAVIKYVVRHREKNGREDLEKAIHYLQMLIEQEYPKESGREAVAELARADRARADLYGWASDKHQENVARVLRGEP
jgi:hypothetical protein